MDVHRFAARIVACVAMFGLTFPVAGFAEPISDPSAVVDPVLAARTSCRAYNAAYRFADSLPFCLAAAEMYRHSPTSVPKDAWIAVYAQADMLAYAAADRVGLKEHVAALQTAFAAHQLVVYIDRTFRLEPADRDHVVLLARELRQLETSESRALRAQPAPIAPTRRAHPARTTSPTTVLLTIFF